MIKSPFYEIIIYYKAVSCDSGKFLKLALNLGLFSSISDAEDVRAKIPPPKKAPNNSAVTSAFGKYPAAIKVEKQRRPIPNIAKDTARTFFKVLEKLLAHSIL